jgi:hypothetical protein
VGGVHCNSSAGVIFMEKHTGRKIECLGVSSLFLILIIIIFTICSTYCLFFADWSTGDGNKFTSMVYLVTLIVIIFYTNYTFQIAKFTAKGPALLAVQIQHSNVLRDFLKIWRSSVENKRSMEHAITKKELARNNQRNLDAYWEYRDFVDYHLPSDYHTLVTYWQRFEKINSDLDKLSYNLYSRLESDLNDKVIGISKEINIEPDTKYFDNFVSRIYETCCMYFILRVACHICCNFTVALYPDSTLLFQ